MALKTIRMEELVEACVHLGHTPLRMSPNMGSYVWGTRNGIDIIDLEQTITMLRRASNVVCETTKNRGNILFVGTRNDISNIVGIAAKRCWQPYVTSRWVGGTLTNWKEVFRSIEKLRMYERNKKTWKKYSPSELREYRRLKSNFQGMINLNSLPYLLFIIDSNKHSMAIKEANRLSIPTIAVVDTNSNVEGITYPIPGNDDSMEAVYLYCDLISRGALEGLKKESLNFLNLAK